MKKRVLGIERNAFLILLLLLFLPSFFIMPTSSGENPRAKTISQTKTLLYQDEEILVKFKKRINANELSSLENTLGKAAFKEFSYLSEQKGKSYVLVQAAGQSTDQLLNTFVNLPEVEAVSPNYRRYLTAIPNDPHWIKLWGLNKISAANAWDLTVGSPSVIVAVIDTGVDYTHEDLIDNMWHNPGEIPNNNTDDDHNGYEDDYYGYDFAAANNGKDAPEPMDIDYHGTHVSGIVSAVGNNGIGVCGISWNTKIMALKIVRPDGSLLDSDAIEAIEYAVMMKNRYHANIAAMNASWGGSFHNPFLEDAIDEAEKANIIFVAAAGNGGDDNEGNGENLDQKPFYPACYTNANIITVAATDANDQLAGFSNYGASSVDIAAPGVQVYSTVPFGKVEESRVLLGGEALDATLLEYAGKIPAYGINALVIDCGKGLQISDFPPSVSGNIALLERGESKFREKVILAQNAGAVAALIYNNQSGNFNGTLCEAGDLNCQSFPWIPAVSLSQADGQKLKGMVPAYGTILQHVTNYAHSNGTSMATPHVAGVAALLAAYYPNENFRQRIGRILAGCDPVPDLTNKIITGGRLNAWQSLRLGVAISLFALRKTGVGWMVERDTGWVKLEVAADKMGQITGGRFLIQRKEGNSSFTTIKTISESELRFNSYEFYDKYIEKEKRYTYRTQVFNSRGELVGSSNQQTI